MTESAANKIGNIAVISPTFPPAKCGVGDHTLQLIISLRNTGHKITLITAEPQASKDVADSVIRVPKPWGKKAFLNISKHLIENNISAVIIQYTPYLFLNNMTGTNIWLCLWILQIKRKAPQITIGLLAHELHYPVKLSFHGIVKGLPMYLQFLTLTSISHIVFFTYRRAMSLTQKRLPLQSFKMTYIPVGSNISYVNKISKSQARSELFNSFEIKGQPRILLHFGGLHPTHLLHQQVAALNLISSQNPKNPTLLVLAGASHDALLKLTGNHSLDRISQYILATGHLPPEMISKWLVAADLVLAPFMDGISTRRGSVMAAFSHGCTVLSTDGWATDPGINWNSFCSLVSSENLDAFAPTALKLLSSPETLACLGKQAQTYYQDNFDWPIISQAIIGAFAEARSKPGNLINTPLKNQKNAASGL